MLLSGIVDIRKRIVRYRRTKLKDVVSVYDVVFSYVLPKGKVYMFIDVVYSECSHRPLLTGACCRGYDINMKQLYFVAAFAIP